MIKETYLFAILPDAHIKFTLIATEHSFIVDRVFTRSPRTVEERRLGARAIASKEFDQWLRDTVLDFSIRHNVALDFILKAINSLPREVPFEDDQSPRRF